MVKTAAERQADRRARLRREGIQEVRGIFATAEQSAQIKAYAKRLRWNTRGDTFQA